MDNIFFLSCFLPLVLIIYWLVPGMKGKNAVLLVFSLLFYSFGSLSSLALLVAVTLVNYLLGLLLQREKLQKAALTAGIVLDLAFLAFFKYADFLLSGVLGLAPLQTGLAAPLGISFFTFKCISYLMDAYRESVTILCGAKHGSISLFELEHFVIIINYNKYVLDRGKTLF